jgi:hypothetical protein
VTCLVALRPAEAKAIDEADVNAQAPSNGQKNALVDGQ